MGACIELCANNFRNAAIRQSSRNGFPCKLKRGGSILKVFCFTMNFALEHYPPW